MEWNKNVLTIEEVYTESKQAAGKRMRMPCIIMRILLP